MGSLIFMIALCLPGADVLSNKLQVYSSGSKCWLEGPLSPGLGCDDTELQKADASWKEGMKQTRVGRVELHPWPHGTQALLLPACLHLLM